MTDRYAHIVGDFYLDKELYPWWYWGIAAVLCIAFPPGGLFLLAFFGFGSITTNPDDD